LDPNFAVAQAKQKFGSLRLYLERYAPGTHELIDAASRQSRTICEACGAPGVLRSTKGGYFSTVCDEHGANMVVAKQDPIVASFRLGPDGLEEIDRGPPG
jgi:hypothetical protein